MERFLISRKTSEQSNEPLGSKANKISAPLKGKKRKYQDEYLQYGFIASENDPSLPFCLICAKTLGSDSMNPSKLIRHLESKHPLLKNNPIEYFEHLKLRIQSQSSKIKKYINVSDQAQLASFKIAQLLARKKKSHAEAEEIVGPALKIAAECMLTNDAVEKLKHIPLSSKTIARRIQELSNDIELQLSEGFRNNSGKWAIQLDESTDISNKAQLLSFLRFIKGGKIVNEYFFCQELSQTTTGEDIFELIDKNVKKYNLNWENCISICTDGAPAMQGRKKGFVAHALKKNDNIQIVHCMLHREALLSKALPSTLKETLSEVVNVVNFIKSNALRSRIFSALCDAMESNYKTLLYHTEVRWLSKGKVLDRFVILKVEIISFIDTMDTDFTFLKDDSWWLRVSFLSDMFDKLNEINLSLQGAQENFITISSKLNSFKEKLSMWRSKVAKSNFGSFPTVDSNSSKGQIKKEMEETLESLSTSFLKYFPSLNIKEMEWVVNPFVECEAENLGDQLEENLIDLRNDLIYKKLFIESEVSEFWLSLSSKFPQLSSKAIDLLLPFGSSYLCEHGFSALTEMKSKKRERLQMIDEEMRVCLSKTEPRISLICSEKQSQVSH